MNERCSSFPIVDAAESDGSWRNTMLARSEHMWLRLHGELHYLSRAVKYPSFRYLAEPKQARCTLYLNKDNREFKWLTALRCLS